MSTAEYYLAFESILYGLIISKILIKWAEMIKAKGVKSYHWAYILLTINVFCLIVYIFWVNREPEHYENIAGPLMFLIHVVVPPSIFTFMTFQMFPNEFSEMIQKDYLIKYRRNIFIPWVVYLVYNLYVLTENLFILRPYTLGTFILIILTGFIIKFPKIIFINIFILIQTIILIFGYLRYYMF